MALGGKDLVDVDMLSLVVDVCGRCGTADCEVKCVLCEMEFHKRCVSKTSLWSSNDVVCDECADTQDAGTGRADSLNETIVGWLW